MPKFAVILAAAGRSTRFRSEKRKKPFVDLKGRAVWLRSAELFVGRDDVAQTLIAVAPGDVEWFKDKFRPNLAFMDFEVVEGGAERADTVERVLARVQNDIDFVAVHDAARPLIVKEWIDQLFEAAVKHGAVIPAVPVTSTLKRTDAAGKIIETVPRDGLWLAQTPQVFRRQLLLDAFARRKPVGQAANLPTEAGSFGNVCPATDESSLVEALGEPVTVIEGWPMNIKITTRGDFKMAEALLDALPRPNLHRALHPFADEEPRLL